MNNEFAKEKLHYWRGFLECYELPLWEEIPNDGLLMDQLEETLKSYLNYLPDEIAETPLVTPSAINNYVRIGIMPRPIKKKYYRIHIAYLIIILTLKGSLSMAEIAVMFPSTLSEEEICFCYDNFRLKHRATSQYFLEELAGMVAPLTGKEQTEKLSVSNVENLTAVMSILGGFCRALGQMLVRLQTESEIFAEAAESAESVDAVEVTESCEQA